MYKDYSSILAKKHSDDGISVDEEELEDEGESTPHTSPEEEPFSTDGDDDETNLY